MRGLRVALALTSAFILSSCSCSDRIKLVNACSHRSVKQMPCTGTEEDFVYETRKTRKELNTGTCESGTIMCRLHVYTKSEHCGDDEVCLDNWDNIRTDDICVGSVWATGELCDDLDNDCDGQVDEAYDNDNDGHKTVHATRPDGTLCGSDCDDRNELIHPEASEICDGLDNNCNLFIDEGMEDLGVCHPDVPSDIELQSLSYSNSDCSYETGVLKCVDAEVQCVGASFQGPKPEACDGVDNNCNGFVDEPDSIGGLGEPCGSDIGVCTQGYLVCDSVTNDVACFGAYGGEATDSCDGLDNDCDASTDEDAEPILCTNGCPEYGYQNCVDGEYTVCDAPMPVDESEEPCNGEDDDCDGRVDEGQECQCDPAEVGPNPPDCDVAEMVEAGLTCGKAKKDCVCRDGDCRYGECYRACDPLHLGDSPATWWGTCDLEKCDGWDHDCDTENVNGAHLVDAPCACDPNSPVPEIARAAQNGNCEMGLCTAGRQTCEFDERTEQWKMSPDDCGAVGPEEEVCDEQDNDCDGASDEELSSFDKVDMVFVIDITGSMAEEIQAVHEAVSAYAQDFRGTEHRFALLVYPAPPSWTPVSSCEESPYYNLSGGLVGVDRFLNLLLEILNNGLECSEEPAYDILFDLSDPQDPAGVGWRDDAYPYIFLFGDEIAQTWTDLTEPQVAARTQTCDGIGGCPCEPPDCPVFTNNFEIHCFVSRAFELGYDDICQTYSINSISPEMLRNIFADVCLP